MAMGKRERDQQSSFWVATSALPAAASHPFYERVNQILATRQFDDFVESQCGKFYHERLGRPSLPPGVYFRCLLIGYFEGLDSERGIAWRAEDSLGIRRFLGYTLTDTTPDHSTISRTRRLADLDRLLDGAPIHLANCDPPYNVRVEPRSNNAIASGNSSFAAPERTHHQSFDVARQGEKKRTTQKMRAKDRPLANDFVTDEAFNTILAAWFGNIARVLLPGRGFYIWGGYANLGNYPGPLKTAGLYFSQGIVWDKQHPVLTRKDFMGAFEICFYGWREGAAHVYLGPNNATDLWHVKKVNPQSMVHLTEKPVELAARAIQYSSRPGENILDLFGGSGSSLIAAEQTGRRAFLMELDAPYCDVIVKRWSQFTGREPIRVASEGSSSAGTEELSESRSS